MLEMTNVTKIYRTGLVETRAFPGGVLLTRYQTTR